MPLVTDENGRRLAKRSDDVALARLRAAGADPRLIVAWTARSAGIPTSAAASPHEVLPLFEMDKLPRSEVRLTRNDLLAVGFM